MTETDAHAWFYGSADRSFRSKNTRKRKGTYQMRIAVTYENGMVFQHFGHTEFFKLYEKMVRLSALRSSIPTVRDMVRWQAF